jgi:RecA/RadA recombinase
VTLNIKTDCKCIDDQLGDGISAETITMIYGEPETGKTTLVMQCAVSCANKKLKTLFIDCDNTFHTERLNQISYGKFDEIAELILLMKPKNFAEQTVIVDHLPEYIGKNFGLVIVDTFNSLYRAKMAETSTKGSFQLNRELNRQLALLAQAAKTIHVPIIVTSQVRSVFNEISVDIAPVATRVLQFWADTIIALKPTENPQIIKAVIEKNRNAQEATCYLRISELGVHDI